MHAQEIITVKANIKPEFGCFISFPAIELSSGLGIDVLRVVLSISYALELDEFEGSIQLFPVFSE